MQQLIELLCSPRPYIGRDLPGECGPPASILPLALTVMESMGGALAVRQTTGQQGWAPMTSPQESESAGVGLSGGFGFSSCSSTKSVQEGG